MSRHQSAFSPGTECKAETKKYLAAD